MWFWCLTIWERKLCRRKNPEKWKNQKCQHICLQQSLHCIVNVYFCLPVATEIFLHECCGLFKLNLISPTFPLLLTFQSAPYLFIVCFPCYWVCLNFWITITVLQKKQRAFLSTTIQNTTLNQFLSLLQKHPLTRKKYPARGNPLGPLITPVASHTHWEDAAGISPYCLASSDWFYLCLLSKPRHIWVISGLQLAFISTV